MTTRTRNAPGLATPGSRVRLQIAGMSCNSCVARVRSALESVAGLRVIDVRRGSAIIELQPEGDSHALVRAIAAAGYEVIGVQSLDASVEPAIRNHATGGGGCCCRPEAAHHVRG